MADKSCVNGAEKGVKGGTKKYTRTPGQDKTRPTNHIKRLVSLKQLARRLDIIFCKG